MASSDPAEAGLSVLVVSDDPIVREQARYGFPSDVRVSFAIDSREAWQVLQSEDASVVVVDMQTGSAGGFGLTRDMAVSERLARVPVVLLLERGQDSWLARRAGATSYHTKPLAPGALVRATLAAAERAG